MAASSRRLTADHCCPKLMFL